MSGVCLWNDLCIYVHMYEWDMSVELLDVHMHE